MENNPLEKINRKFEFGLKLSRKRILLGKTVSLIAEKLKTPVNNVTRWESGETFPEEEKLPIIAEAYGIALEDLEEKYRISKETRKEEKNNRWTLNKKRVPLKENMFSGRIEPGKIKRKLNEEEEIREISGKKQII